MTIYLVRKAMDVNEHVFHYSQAVLFI